MFKVFFSIFSSMGHFVQRSGIVLTILVKGYKRNICVNYFEIRPLA